jgi:hypothetical protein
MMEIRHMYVVHSYIANVCTYIISVQLTDLLIIIDCLLIVK